MNLNIILFTNKGGQISSFEINPLRSGLLASMGMALLCALPRRRSGKA
jgi:hypothetical protein